MLKLNMWSNHIPVLQILSSNLDLEESRFFLSRASIRSLWISTQDQSEIVLFGIDFLSKKNQPANLNETWIAINSLILSLIFFFSYSLAFLSLIMKQSETKNQQTKGTPKLLWAWKMEDAQALDVCSSRRREGRRERGRGYF